MLVLIDSVTQFLGGWYTLSYMVQPHAGLQVAVANGEKVPMAFVRG